MSRATLTHWRTITMLSTTLLTLLLACWGSGQVGTCQEPPVAPTCPHFGEGLAMGIISDPSLNEASGLAASRDYPGLFWSHNDSGDFARLYALTLDGSSHGIWTIPVGIPFDCEALAIGPAPDAPGDHIFLADIGNNGLGRDYLLVHRIPEPIIADSAKPNQLILEVVTFEVFLPAGMAEDLEAFAVDPIDGAFLFFTKRYSPVSYFLTAPAPHSGEEVHLAKVGSLPISMVTGADISLDGSLLALRTYEEVLIFERHDGESWPEALHRPACPQPLAWEHQGEAIAFLPDNSGYVTLSEGSHQPVIFYPRLFMTAEDNPR